MINAMLINGNLPKNFWREALLTACHRNMVESFSAPRRSKRARKERNLDPDFINSQAIILLVEGLESSVTGQRHCNNQRPSVLGKPAIFSDSLERKDFSKSKSVTQNNVSNDFSKPVTTQTLPPNKKYILKNMNELAPGMYKLHTLPTQARTSQLSQDSKKTNKRVSFSTGVIPITSVSRPQLKSNPMGDRVMRNNSQGKKQDVEDHPRSVKFSKNKTSVTALQAQVRVVRTDKGTKFLNQTLHSYFAAEGIQHQTSVARTPEQNGVVERQNRTLVEAARTMLSAAKVPLFFWAEAIATACFTQNRSLVIPRHEKTPYHIINDRKPPIKFFYIFGFVCYIVRDGENLDKMKEKGDECIFVGYSTQSRAYRVFNKRTRVIMESIHVNFDELLQMASAHNNSDPAPTCQTKASVQISSDPAPECQTMALEHDSLKGILHQTSVARTPEQNGAEAIATTCFTQNHSPVIPRHEKTPYHIINDQKPSVKFFYMFGSLCYIVRDGENLDKMKEKCDACIFVGYSTQSRAYIVFNKRTRVIVETIHVNFDELPQMVSNHVSSDPRPESQGMTLEHDSLSPGPQCQENVTQTDKTVTTSNELDLLFSLMFDELLNGSSKVVSKSFVIASTDAHTQHQQQHTTPLNNQTTPDPTCQVPPQAPTVTSTKNINQAEMVEEYAQVKNDKFINIFYTPVQDRGETSSRHVDSSNMHTFYQHHPSEHRWTKDHPLKQVIGNPS
nr:retrovirus-related Pol polyprotein from transposon TNT 1-94 [Tanacetum cinerariifolium]